MIAIKIKLMRPFASITFLLLSSLFILTEASSLCNNETSLGLRTFENLFSHCLENTRCAHQFGLDMNFVNKTTFDVLIESVITNYDSYYDPLERVCEAQTAEELMEFIWPLIMLAESRENFLQCPFNFVLQVRSDGTQQCVCESGSDCSTSSDDDTLIIVLLYILIAAAVILIIILFLKTFPDYVNLFKEGPLANYDYQKAQTDVRKRGREFVPTRTRVEMFK